MPDLARVRALLGAGVIVGAFLAGPGLLVSGTVVPASAQTDVAAPLPARWTSTTFEEPFDEFEVRTLRQVQPLVGTLRYERRSPTDQITQASLSSVDDPEDDYVLDDDCPIPPVLDLPDSQNPGTHAELAIDTDLEHPCNGRYLVAIHARGGSDDPIVIRRSLLVQALPPGIVELEVNVDDEADVVDVAWTPLSGGQLAPDVLGYLVERAGPRTDEDGFGLFVDLATTSVFDDATYVDTLPEPGSYRYRIRTRKQSPSGPVLSSILESSSVEVTQAPPPTTSTTSTSQPPTTSGSGSGSNSITIPRPTRRPPPTFATPTTADTGFDSELDYGPLGTPGATPTAPALAGEELGGQSIVRDEGEGINVLIPAAGALVLVGWAAHIAYLNRLAKDLDDS